MTRRMLRIFSNAKAGGLCGIAAARTPRARLLAVFLGFALPCLAQGQIPGGGQPAMMQQAMQDLGDKLADVNAHPNNKAQILEQMKNRMTMRGVPDIDRKLAEVGKILDKATAMSGAELQQNKQDLATQAFSVLRGGSSGPAGGRTAKGGSDTPAPPHVSRSTNAVPWIDVHNHLLGPKQLMEGAVAAALPVMDQCGITRMIVMPTPCDAAHVRPDCENYLDALRPYSKRLSFMGGGSSLNSLLQKSAAQTALSDSVRRQFEQIANTILQQGAIGFGEIALHHLSLHGNEHPYECVPADHPLLLLLADIAARHDVPIDVHFDVVTEDIPIPPTLASKNNPAALRANLAAFERLLDHNPKAKICWAHAGSDNIGHWTTDLSRMLLQKHPNLYMSLRVGPGRVPQNFPLNMDGQIKPEWLQLLKDFPTRFVIGSDQFFASDSFSGSNLGASLAARAPLTRQLTPALLGALPPDLAKKVGSENAIAIYKLKN